MLDKVWNCYQSIFQWGVGPKHKKVCLLDKKKKKKKEKEKKRPIGISDKSIIQGHQSLFRYLKTLSFCYLMVHVADVIRLRNN